MNTLVAYFNPLWLVDSGPYDVGSSMSDARQTVYLRCLIMMATVLAPHGIARAFAAHLRGLLCNEDVTEMVQAKIAEWHSHRAHQQSFMQAFPPCIFTRISWIVLPGQLPCVYLCVALGQLGHSCHTMSFITYEFLLQFSRRAKTRASLSSCPPFPAACGGPPGGRLGDRVAIGDRCKATYITVNLPPARQIAPPTPQR